MGAVSLMVSDLDRSMAYYQQHIGLRLLDRSDGTAVLGAGETPLVNLHHLPNAAHTTNVTGLYHFALLLPSRLDLARVLSHFVQARTLLTGAADHLFSEALYLSDPDGHGIEIYRDRSRERWYNRDGILVGDTLPLDVDDLMSELDGKTEEFDGLPEAAVMGHMHLHVANLPDAEQFYLGIIGLNKPKSTLEIPTASFLGAGGYHHHLGINIWAGVGAPPPPADAARLLNYEILFPNNDALEGVLQRLDAAYIEPQHTAQGWLVRDPSQNGILLRAAPVLN
jgi:catechol 2,3-dioxygenase